jgi:hypothetical protein
MHMVSNGQVRITIATNRFSNDYPRPPRTLSGRSCSQVRGQEAVGKLYGKQAFGQKAYPCLASIGLLPLSRRITPLRARHDKCRLAEGVLASRRLD